MWGQIWEKGGSCGEEEPMGTFLWAASALTATWLHKRALLVPNFLTDEVWFLS